MIEKNKLTVRGIIYRSFMSVDEFIICGIFEDHILVKRIDDLFFTKVFMFELNTDIWHESNELAKNLLSFNNGLLHVSPDSIGYHKEFNTATLSDIRENDVFYESCFGGSQFIGATVKQFSVVKVEILDRFVHNGTNVLKLRAKEIDQPDESSDTFNIYETSLLSIKNIFKNEKAVFNDMIKSTMANLRTIKLLYEPAFDIYKSLSDDNKLIITKYINEMTTKAEYIRKSHEEYLAREKTETTVANAEKDAMDIIKAIN